MHIGSHFYWYNSLGGLTTEQKKVAWFYTALIIKNREKWAPGHEHNLKEETKLIKIEGPKQKDGSSCGVY